MSAAVIVRSNGASQRQGGLGVGLRDAVWFGLTAAVLLFVAVDRKSCSRRINFFLERRGWPGEWCDSFWSGPCTFEPRRSVSGKSLRCDRRVELLKQIAPSVTRVAVLRNPAIIGAMDQLAAIQTAAMTSNVSR